MTKRSRKTLMIWALSVLSLVATAIAYSFLPEEIPMWWNFHGTVLHYAEKNNIWLIASLAAVFAVLFTVLPLIDPRNKNYQRFMEYYETFTLVMVVAGDIITGVVISESFRPGKIEVGQLVVLIAGLISMVMGNLMPKIKSNYFIGIRNPWTLSDPDIWNRTHRIGGRIFFIFGLCEAVHIHLEQTTNVKQMRKQIRIIDQKRVTINMSKHRGDGVIIRQTHKPSLQSGCETIQRFQLRQHQIGSLVAKRL